MRTKLLRVGLPLLVVLVTALAVSLWYRKTNSAEQRFADTFVKSQHVLGEYFNADYDSAKAAMLDHILLLDRLSVESGNPARNPHSVDAMSWFVRLAKLEERNDRGGRGDYIREACFRCERLGWADCSEERLSRQIDGMDAIARSQLSVGPK